MGITYFTTQHPHISPVLQPAHLHTLPTAAVGGAANVCQPALHAQLPIIVHNVLLDTACPMEYV